MPAVSRIARRRWYVFKHSNAGSSQDPQTSFIVGYLLAYREAVTGSAAFAGLPEQLHRLSELLEDTEQWQAAADGAIDESELDEDERAELEQLVTPRGAL